LGVVPGKKSGGVVADRLAEARIMAKKRKTFLFVNPKLQEQYKKLVEKQKLSPKESEQLAEILRASQSRY
jgi:hypothetical protein